MITRETSVSWSGPPITPPRRVPDEAIDARPLGPLARLILGIMKHAGSPELLAFYLAHAEDVRELLATEHGRLGLFMRQPHLQRDTLIRHLAPLVGPGLEHTMHTFMDFLLQKAVDQVSGEVFDKGVEKGVEKGQREFLLDQLTEGFGSLPATVTERIAQASRQDLKRSGSRILNAASLDDVFASS